MSITSTISQGCVRSMTPEHLGPRFQVGIRVYRDVMNILFTTLYTPYS